jgi:hypothetical protein
MRPGLRVPRRPQGRSNIRSVSTPSSTRVMYSKTVAVPIAATKAPHAADRRVYPRVRKMKATPVAVAAMVAFGWIEIPSLSQSVRSGTSAAHPKNDVAPASATYAPRNNSARSEIVVVTYASVPRTVTLVMQGNTASTPSVNPGEPGILKRLGCTPGRLVQVRHGLDQRERVPEFLRQRLG